MKSISDDITNTEGGNSQEVGWYFGDETEDQPLVIYGILAMLILGASAMFSLRASSKDKTYGDVAEIVVDAEESESVQENEDDSETLDVAGEEED